MSGTTTSPKIGSFACTNGATVATGTTLSFKWNLYPASAGATELHLQGSNDGGRTYQSWHRPPVTATATTKGGVVDGAWLIRLLARKGTAEMPGSASDPVSVRVGPAPVTTPTPTPAPAPSYATAADLAALASRVAALENAGLPAKLEALTARVTALENEPRVTPAQLRRVGASTAADEMLAVRAGEIVVVTRG